MSLKDLANKARHLVVEDEPVPVKPAVSKASSVLTVTAPSSALPTNYATILPTKATGSSTIYDSLKAKTDFAATEVGRVVMQYYNNLEGTGMDESMRYKTAITLASKQNGVTPQSILTAFDTMNQQLQKESDAFSQVAKLNEGKEIVTRQNRMTEIDDQIARLSQEKMTLSTDLMKAQMNHNDANQQFSLSLQKRGAEIAQQRAQFAAMLSQ
jgi:hypothetical protein